MNVIYTHKLDLLMSASGLLPDFNRACADDAYLEANWGVVTKWNEQSRYEIIDAIAAATLISAIVDVDHGMLRWLERNW